MPTFDPLSLATRITLAIIHLTASSCSSNKSANNPESLSTPKVNCVKSFDPMENPSKCSVNLSAKITFDGISHMT